LEHVIVGRLNKQIAYDLGTCEQTIKVHRGNLMKKLQVKTFLELLRLAERAGIKPIVAT
jgi:FixJ family two-component response regulator